MSEMVGITRQREGAISNRETVGGVERSVLQSSHITEYLFMTHENVKKRALECFIETAKAAMKGKSLKFQYILSDGTAKIVDIDGDEFCENDYGITVENSKFTQDLITKLEGLAQAMVQNQMMSASSLIKIFSDSSTAEIMRTIQEDERNLQERQSEQQEAQNQLMQQEMEMKSAVENRRLDVQEQANIRDNETKLIIAGLSQQSNEEGLTEEQPFDLQKKQDLEEKIRQFDAKLSLDREKFNFDKDTTKEELKLKNKQINKQSNMKK